MPAGVSRMPCEVNKRRVRTKVVQPDPGRPCLKEGSEQANRREAPQEEQQWTHHDQHHLSRIHETAEVADEVPGRDGDGEPPHILRVPLSAHLSEGCKSSAPGNAASAGFGAALDAFFVQVPMVGIVITPAPPVPRTDRWEYASGRDRVLGSPVRAVRRSPSSCAVERAFVSAAMGDGASCCGLTLSWAA